MTETGWRARIAENRRQIDVDLACDPDARRMISPALLGLTDSLAPRLSSLAKGQFLDAGCGTQPFRSLVEHKVDRYLSYDMEDRSGRLDLIGSVEDMRSVPSGSVDTLLCSEVLEHVAHPQWAIAEFARVVRPDRPLVLTVPFLARLHEEPHDYFRYTRHGIRTLLDEGGFTVDEIVETGSLFSFVGHQVSVGLLGLTWHMPRIRRLAIAINRVLVVQPAVALDRITKLSRLLPLGYVVTATRRQD